MPVISFPGRCTSGYSTSYGVGYAAMLYLCCAYSVDPTPQYKSAVNSNPHNIPACLGPRASILPHKMTHGSGLQGTAKNPLLFTRHQFTWLLGGGSEDLHHSKEIYPLKAFLFLSHLLNTKWQLVQLASTVAFPVRCERGHWASQQLKLLCLWSQALAESSMGCSARPLTATFMLLHTGWPFNPRLSPACVPHGWQNRAAKWSPPVHQYSHLQVANKGLYNFRCYSS